ncbi:hypothetical protein [Kordia sp.]|uniref:hypothetical protein n=1 Tax=Kordia sp. TaxID=1965332 RepID=UPI003B5987FF
MKNKRSKKMSLNKRAISNLTKESLTGGITTTNTTTIDPFRTITVLSGCCANTIDDYTCDRFCTIA